MRRGDIISIEKVISRTEIVVKDNGRYRLWPNVECIGHEPPKVYDSMEVVRSAPDGIMALMLACRHKRFLTPLSD